MATESQDEWGGDYNALSDPEERRVLFGALSSFLNYRKASHFNTTHTRRQAFYALPSAQWELLASPPFSFLDTLSAIDDYIDSNADIAEAILSAGLPAFGLSCFGPPANDGFNDGKPAWQIKPSANDVQKAHSTIRQFYRDWSAEGAIEREACYDPVIKALETEYESIPVADRGTIRVLVPGAGLGRSVFEIVRAGFGAEGNEISYHQLLASSWILNYLQPKQQFPLYPWVSSFANHVSREHQLQKVMIPDVHPGATLEAASADSKIHAFERLSMSAADFCVAYKEEQNKNAFDAVATIFFIDTAPNVIAYIETVHHCLKPGGIWINMGPLLWHFEDQAGKRNDTLQSPQGNSSNLGIGEPGSMELTDEEVTRLIAHFGFTIERHETRMASTGYIQNPRSMMESMYRPSFWVARKK